jgi:transcription initiation factor TFIID subunit 11
MSEPPKRARDEQHADDTISDLSDGELDAAIITNPLSNNKRPMAMSGDSVIPDADLYDPEEDDEEDDEEEEENEHHRTLSLLSRDDQVKARLAAAHQSVAPLLSTLSPDQQRRYETFRRSGFPRPQIKKMISKIWGGAGTGASAAHAVIVVAGIAKVFVGELVEEAKEVARVWGEGEGSALLPSHYREAHRRLVMAGKLSNGTGKGNILL